MQPDCRPGLSTFLAVLGLAVTVVPGADFGYYALSVPIGAALLLGGFLAVFAAAIALHQTERRLPGQAPELVHRTLVVVTLSIVVHGISARPAMTHSAGRADAVRAPKQQPAESVVRLPD